MKLGLIVFGLAVSGMVTTGDAWAQGRQGRGAVQQMRFIEMDQNRDGVIARSEWRGSTAAFQTHDWDGDGRLSGDEVRLGRQRPGRGAMDDNFGSAYEEYSFNDWSARGFTALDHNKDARLTRDEWHFDRQDFIRADHNADGAISRVEFLSEDAEDDVREDGLADLDLNNDGRVSRQEWLGTPARFSRLDADRDGFLSRTDVVGSQPPAELFGSVDVNRDQVISRTEWHWSRESFDLRDMNKDGRLSRDEFNGATMPATQGSAYRAGGLRGTDEGRIAGHEDRVRNQGWDLEGQSELVSADSGYDPRVGGRPEYQAGYRESFRRAYREGWDQP